MATDPNSLAPSHPWRAAQSRAQYAAIAWLRWRIFLNQFRRKGGVGDLIAQIIIVPIFSGVVLGLSFVAGLGAWYFASNDQLAHISWLLWGAFLLCQFLNINLGQPGTTFDPTQLIRFPLNANTYVAIKLFFGLLTPANILITLLSLAVAGGVTIVMPSLWLYSFAALLLFAATNVLFSRMIFAWVDRWLSTRRAREVFTLCIFLASLGFQWINANFIYGGQHHHSVANQQRIELVTQFYNRIHPALTLLPPEVISLSLIAAQHGKLTHYITLVFYCACFAALFLAVFAIRTRTEYHGEAFSDAANGVSKAPSTSLAPSPLSATPGLSATTLAPAKRNAFGLSSQVAGLFGKEFLTMRRNTGIFYSIIAPVVMVLIFAGRFALHGNHTYLFPIALSYAMLGIVPLSYNSFGLEGAGCQFYFLAPIEPREIFIAKNLMLVLVAALEVAAVFAIICSIGAAPPPQIAMASLLWAIMTLLASLTLGNRRSITAAKKIDLGRAASKQASPLSALISMGVLLALAALGYGLLMSAVSFNLLWSLPLIMGVLAAMAMVIYLRDLRAMNSFLYAHREELFEELCKK